MTFGNLQIPPVHSGGHVPVVPATIQQTSQGTTYPSYYCGDVDFFDGQCPDGHGPEPTSVSLASATPQPSAPPPFNPGSHTFMTTPLTPQDYQVDLGASELPQELQLSTLGIIAQGLAADKAAKSQPAAHSQRVSREAAAARAGRLRTRLHEVFQEQSVEHSDWDSTQHALASLYATRARRFGQEPHHPETRLGNRQQASLTIADKKSIFDLNDEHSPTRIPASKDFSKTMYVSGEMRRGTTDVLRALRAFESRTTFASRWEALIALHQACKTYLNRGKHHENRWAMVDLLRAAVQNEAQRLWGAPIGL